MQKKISIIIPVYNGEEYIARCIDSVLVQKDFDVNGIEILLLNDGSKDGSLKILQQYAKQYPYIVKVLTHKNMGVAKTRNKGIEIAKGKYLTFIDQDDWIDDDWCTTFYKIAEDGKYDVVLGGYKRTGSGMTIVTKKLELKNTPFAKYILPAQWAKLHKTDFIRRNNIQTFDDVYGEDAVFAYTEMVKSDRVGIAQGYSGYHWFYNKKSVSNTKFKKIISMLPSFKHYMDTIKRLDNKTPEFEYVIMLSCCSYLAWGAPSSSRTDFLNCYKEVFDWLNKNYPNYRKNKYILFGPRGSTIIARVVTGVFTMLDRLHLVPLFAAVYCRGK